MWWWLTCLCVCLCASRWPVTLWPCTLSTGVAVPCLSLNRSVSHDPILDLFTLGIRITSLQFSLLFFALLPPLYQSLATFTFFSLLFLFTILRISYIYIYTKLHVYINHTLHPHLPHAKSTRDERWKVKLRLVARPGTSYREGPARAREKKKKKKNFSRWLTGERAYF